MKQESFEYLWNFIIKNEIEAVYYDLCKKYENARKCVKSFFFDSGYRDEKLIDLHKIGSCIISSMSDYNIIEYKLCVDLPNEIFLSNYAIALISGINTVYALRLWELKESGAENELELLSKQKGFYYPQTNSGHEDYLLGRIKALALNRANQIDFDLLAYADMLFWIDTANIGIIRSELRKKA